MAVSLSTQMTFKPSRRERWLMERLSWRRAGALVRGVEMRKVEPFPTLETSEIG